MEMLEDNIVQSKLNSLDTLPEGYTPNLESKWSMLEAGLEGNAKRTVAWKPIAAAAVVLILGGATLLLQQLKPKVAVTADYSKQEVKPKNSTSEPIASAPIPTQIKTAATPTTTKATNTQPVIEHAPAALKVVDEQTVPAQETPQRDAVIEQLQETQPLIAALPKIKKQQFVEIDFNDVPMVKQQIMEPSIAFKPFTFGLEQTAYTKNDRGQQHLFRIQKSF